MLNLPVLPRVDLSPIDPDPTNTQPIPGWENTEPFEILSTTGLARFARCPRLFFYTHMCELTTAGARLPLKFGEAIHKALPQVLVNADLDAAMQDFMSIWQDRDGMNDEKRNTVVAQRMLLHALSAHSTKAPYPVYEMLKPPITAMTVGEEKSDYEIPFVLQIPGSRFLLGSRIDGLARHKATDEEWGLEFKTASSLSSWTLDSFELNIQIMLYTLALRTLYKPSIPGCLLHAFYVARQPSKTVPESIIKPVHVQPHILDDFVRWVVFTSQMIQLYIDSKNFPKQFSGCSPYSMYGVPGGVCEFKNACWVEDWTQMLSLYVKSDYKPFKLAAEQAMDTKSSDLTWEMSPGGGVVIKQKD